MTVIFDLDYTLFDTSAFKRALMEEFAACGVPEELFLDSYARVSRPEGAWECDYRPDAHVRELSGALSCRPEDMLRRIDRVVRRSKEFLFVGAAEMLDGLRDRGVRLVLLTLGNEGWQRKKIVFAELEHAFDAVRAVAGNKAGAVREFADGGTVVVVNDNGAEIDAMAAAAPDLVYILKRGPKPAPSVAVAAECATITELDAAIRKALGLEK